MKKNINPERLPPQATDIEAVVLGEILIEPSCMEIALRYLNNESFYSENHSIIFNAILHIFNTKKTVDLFSVINKLSENNQLEKIGGVAFVTSLPNLVGSAAYIEQHCMIVAEKAIRRKIIMIANDLSNSMFDESEDFIDAINAFDNAKSELLSITSNGEVRISDAINKTVDKSLSINERTIAPGINTGFNYYDKFSGGLQLTDLVIVAGETSNGKTTLAIDILRHVATHSGRVAIYSYEMSEYQICARLIAAEQGISSKDIIAGNIDRSTLIRLKGNVHRLYNSEFYIIKPSSNSFFKLRNDIVRMVRMYGIELFCIDYLQLLSNLRKGANSSELIGEMCNELKALAVSLNVCIILISQLARGTQPRPTLSRLKGSGDIENAADVVLFSYLPFKYGLMYENVNGTSTEMFENAIITVAKGRNIGTCEFVLEFKKEIPCFRNYHVGIEVNTDNDFFNLANREVIASSPFD